jgi:predicted amidophosphoribosyltransferase
LLFLIWFIGFVVFSLVWLMSRPDRRLCPVCGEQVKKGLITCSKCGYNFAQAASAGSARVVPSPAGSVAMPPGVFPCYRCRAPVWQPMTACSACGAPLTWPTAPARP